MNLFKDDSKDDDNSFEVILTVRDIEYSVGVAKDLEALTLFIWNEFTSEEVDDLYECIGNFLVFIEEEWKNSNNKVGYQFAYVALMGGIVSLKSTLDCVRAEKNF
jgi:hypothetical protein